MSTISASTTTTTAYKVAADTTGTLVLQTGATPTTAVYIDTSQNVGVGVTPSAWGSGWRGLNIGSGSGIANTANTIYSSSNGYNDGTNWKYINSASSGMYYISGNTHAWHTAASGTAGNAITFSQAMTLDASGNLLVGTTSTAAFIDTKFWLSGDSGTTKWGVGPRAALGTAFYVVGQTGSAGVYLPNTAATSWSSASDERLKTEIIPFENAAQKVCSLRAGTGRYLTDDETVSRSFLIAQDVQAVLPEAVTALPDEMGTLGLAYTEVIPLLVAAIKEQQALITQLQADVAALKGAA